MPGDPRGPPGGYPVWGCNPGDPLREGSGERLTALANLDGVHQDKFRALQDLVRVVPVRADSGVHLECNRELGGTGHELDDLGAHEVD